MRSEENRQRRVDHYRCVIEGPPHRPRLGGRNSGVNPITHEYGCVKIQSWHSVAYATLPCITPAYTWVPLLQTTLPLRFHGNDMSVEDYTIPLKLKANQASGAIITTIHTAYNFSESNAPFFDNKFPDFFP